RNSSVLYGFGITPCHLLLARFGVGSMLRTFSATGSIGTWLFGNGVPALFVLVTLPGMTGLTASCEKSPARSAVLGRMAPFMKVFVIWRSPAYEPKKNVLFLTIGPPIVPPNWLRCSGGVAPVFPQSLALKIL